MRIGALVLAGSLAAAPALAQDQQNFGQLERGRYLAYAGDCAACHTVPGGKLYAGGRIIETPFGNIATPNITPDPATGIGEWSAYDFYRALHNGIRRDGAHLYPAFPYPAYTKVTREDANAIWAYLSTVPPVQNKVEANQLPFPFDQREGLAAWNALYFKPGVFKEDPGKSSDWNRGAYLVEGLGHCGTCHTPKNFAGADEDSHFLQGEPLQGWYAPNVTGDGYNGLGKWSVDDIVSLLRDGANAWGTVSGPMAEVITLSTSHLSAADLKAIAVYLKDQPGPQRGSMPQPVAADNPQMQAGKAIYADQCAACHTFSGAGIPRLFPRLAGAPTVLSAKPTSLVRVVLEGTRAVGTSRAPTQPAMPPFGWKLNDAQVAAVLTYVRNAWGNAAPAVTTGDVGDLRGNAGG